MMLPSQQQSSQVSNYGRLLIRLQKDADPLDGLPPTAALMTSIRKSQIGLMKLYDDNPTLSLRPFFTMMDNGKEYISAPRLTVQCFLLGRLTVMDEDNCLLSLLARISHQACRALTITSYVALIKIMVNQGCLRWIGEDDLNCHVSLSKYFLNAFYGTSTGNPSPAPLKGKPVSLGLYSNRFKIRFPK